MSKWFTCQRAYVLVQFTCQSVNLSKACQLLILTCQPAKKRANVLRANVSKVYQLLIFTCQLANKPANLPINLPTCHTACQCFNLACKRAKTRTNFSNIRFMKCYWKFSILFYYKKFYIILDIIIMHTIYRT